MPQPRHSLPVAVRERGALPGCADHHEHHPTIASVTLEFLRPIRPALEPAHVAEHGARAEQSGQIGIKSADQIKRIRDAITDKYHTISTKGVIPPRRPISRNETRSIVVEAVARRPQ